MKSLNGLFLCLFFTITPVTTSAMEMKTKKSTELIKIVHQHSDCLSLHQTFATGILDLARHDITKEILEELGETTEGQTALHLYLSRNLLPSLPASIGKFQQLHLLNLSHNHLSELPGNIEMLTSLRWLYVSNNLLVHLPRLNQLTKLEELDVRENQLNDEELAKLDTLNIVELKTDNQRL